jgi:feruloyl esterase
LHTGVTLGIEISKKLYGEAHKKSYYLGCSIVGRQEWKSVQNFPNGCSGIVDGAPASFNNLTS